MGAFSLIVVINLLNRFVVFWLFAVKLFGNHRRHKRRRKEILIGFIGVARLSINLITQSAAFS